MIGIHVAAFVISCILLVIYTVVILEIGQERGRNQTRNFWKAQAINHGFAQHIIKDFDQEEGRVTFEWLTENEVYKRLRDKIKEND